MCLKQGFKDFEDPFDSKKYNKLDTETGCCAMILKSIITFLLFNFNLLERTSFVQGLLWWLNTGNLSRHSRPVGECQTRINDKEKKVGLD